MKRLWILMLMMLCPFVDDETVIVVDDEPESTEESETETEEETEETEETETEEETEGAPKKESRSQKDIRALRERTQKAEDENRRILAELAEARKPQQAASPTHEQIIRQQEDAILSNPESTDWQKYSVQSARDAREAKHAAARSIYEARDIADKSEFRQLAVTKPKSYEKYKDRVEKLRKTLPDVPRMELYALEMGRDMRDGKIGSTEKSAKPKGGADRGKTPGVTSNVSAKGGKLTDAEKRIKRLENVRI